MRFNLSTMRKVAARAREWRMPPHFRTPIDQPMREQIARKFGTRALMPVWDGLGSSGGGSGYGGGGADGYLEASIGSSSSQDRTFFERLAEWEARRLSDVHNLYVCPICLLWLKSLKPETETEGVEASVYDPLSVLYGSRSIFAWHQRHGLPPEVGAAQCCFRKQSDLNLHLRHGHCLTPKVMRGTRERLGAYQIRGGDGLVHKYLSSLATSTTLSESQRRRAMSDGHVRGYWVSTITDVASTVDADEAGWFSRAALYLALYDEVEAQSRGALIVQADEALFGQRLATTSGASLSEARRSRPSGAASVAEARVFGMDAWRRLGFGGGDDDDLKNFMANDDEEEEEEGGGGGGGEMSHMCP
ncbi:hypothetical protein Ctob_006020 [Chrysochromulina tobinii]|uniref:Uncharacterized protein n=1 Tax=Chrysochromulina tobinii TaxID=1460289 RepID=A0A0M0J879_9EUKA|nr:hypothetical protein Ctob_006020 [Chrysochromulina tobinii]|eukprot:KOO22537.1 hypothetical protein Ctob_006020 [Chrysochromulina sp. CCMP291]